VQLSLDALDRLVETLEERGPLTAVEAARSLFATSSIPSGLACSLLAEVTAGDSRLVCSGASVSLTGGRVDPLLDEAEFVVFDLETTGLSATTDRICEIGAVRVRGLELADSFESLVNPGVSLPPQIARLTGLRDPELRRAPPARQVVRDFVRFTGDALLVAQMPASTSGFWSSGSKAGWPSRRSARPRSPGGCSRGAFGGWASPPWRTSSASRRSPATARCPTPRQRPKSSCS